MMYEYYMHTYYIICIDNIKLKIKCLTMTKFRFLDFHSKPYKIFKLVNNALKF